MPAGSERNELIRELFGRAVALPEAGRRAFLAAACGDDDALLAELESLLRHEPGPDPVDGLATGGIAAQVMLFPAGSQVGPFVIQRLLGSGASGDVYLATQSTPRREVALKILRTGADRGALERFELEGAALARLNHDHVAKVYQVGTAAGGRPYIAMELVTGSTITAYARAHALPLRDRLALFCSLCDALEHIHQSGFIHRDLKPDNVVVPEGSTPPSPKVLDFGIAKAAREPGAGGTVDGTVLGTLEYASPEQITDSRLVDVRSDIYSAGVILYELLSGTRPFRVPSAGLARFVDALRHDEAPPPSRTLALDAPALAAVSGSMQTSPAVLLRSLREDLDWIVLKALRKNPSERYGSAGAFRADVRRYLSGQPVGAHPPTTRYILRKFVARHRVGVAATLAIALALGVGLASTTLLYTLAQRRLRELEGLAADLVSSVNEIQDIPGAMRAKERLVASAARTLDHLGQGHLDLPAERRLADAFERVGQLRADPYTASLGQTDAGVSDLCRAVELRRRIYAAGPDMASATGLMHSSFLLALVMQSGHAAPPDPDSLMKAMIALGTPWVASDTTQGDLVRVLALLEDLDAEYDYSVGHWHDTLARVRHAYALRTRLAASPRATDEDERFVSQSLGRLAYAASDLDSARALAAASLAIQERYFERHPFSYRAHLDLTFSLRNAAYALQRDDSAAAALTLYRRCVALRRTMAHSDSTDVRSQHQLANALEWLSLGWVAVGERDSALAAAREALAIRARILAMRNPPPWAVGAYLQSQRTLARAESRAGHVAIAESLYDAVCADTSAGVPLDGLKRWRDWVERAHTRMRAGHAQRADEELARSAQILRHVEADLRSSGADATPYADLGLAYLHLAQVRRARPRECMGYLRAAAALPDLDREPREVLALVENELGCLLAAAGRPDSALAQLRSALVHCRTRPTRRVIERNLALCAGGGAVRSVGMSPAGHEPGRAMRAGIVAAYDATHDPYDRLDLVVFRMMPVWGELPSPPAASLVRQPVGALGEAAPDPGEPQAGVVRDRP